MFLILTLLLAAHIFADYILQHTSLAEHKRENILALAAHAVTWAFCISLVLAGAGLLSVWKFFFLLATHFIIDWFKIRLFSAKLPIFHKANVTDQLMHFLTVLAVILYPA
jgi:hypothetical protein